MKSRPTAAARPDSSRAADARLVQAAAQHGLEVTGRQRSVLAAGGAHRLDDVQREPAGGRLQQVAVAVRERPAADRLGEQGGVGDLERGEGELGEHARWRASGRPSPRPRARRPGRRRAASRPPGPGRRGDSPRQKVRNARVSRSHHCRLSRTSSVGRPAPSSARASPSKKRWRCQASTIARVPDTVPARPVPEGTSRSTSSRHTGSSVPVADWTAGLRSQSATGASASRPAVPKHWLRGHDRAGLACQRGELGHETALADAGTPADDGQARPARGGGLPHLTGAGPSSVPRPTRPSGARPGRAVAGAAGRRGASVAVCCASTRCSVARVASSGTTPSSRSRTEAQRW